jgi:pSer/pThr/pTyr-binding forkhead associated (FHA) protein
VQIKFDRAENRHLAIDFNSKNGVFVNEKKIVGETPLNDRDVITIGDTAMVYSTDNSPLAQHVLDTFKRYGQGHVRTQTGD